MGLGAGAAAPAIEALMFGEAGLGCSGPAPAMLFDGAAGAVVALEPAPAPGEAVCIGGVDAPVPAPGHCAVDPLPPCDALPLEQATNAVQSTPSVLRHLMTTTSARVLLHALVGVTRQRGSVRAAAHLGATRSETALV
jgi:hypothetical protein